MKRIFILLLVSCLCACTQKLASLSFYSGNCLVGEKGQYYADPNQRREVTFSYPLIGKENREVTEPGLSLRQMQNNFGEKCCGLQDVEMTTNVFSGSVTITATPVFKR